MITKRLMASGSVLVLSALNLASSLPVSAQIKRAPTVSATTRIAPGAFRINRGKPSNFKAFAIRDPKSGKPIAPSTILTLPNGKRIKAAAYYAELNRLERNFSSLGHSLRKPDKSVLLQEVILDRKALQQSSTAITKSQYQLKRPSQTLFSTTLDPKLVQRTIREAPIFKTRPGALPHLKVRPRLSTPQPILAPETLLRSSAKVPSPIVAKTTQPGLSLQPKMLRVQPGSIQLAQPGTKFKKLKLKPKPVAAKTYSKSWSRQVGRKKTVQAYISAKLRIKSHPNYSSTYAEGKAGGYLFNRHAQLLRATASVNTRKSTNRASIAVKLNTLGQTVYNFQKSRKAVYVHSDSYSKSIDKRVADIRFSIGPIPMRAKFGVRGSAGVRYTVGLNALKTYAYARVNPFVNSRAYGQGGVDIVVAEAGVGANLTLLNDNLDVRSKVKVGLAANQKAYLKLDMSAYNRLTALKGRLYAYAGVYVPRWGIPPWKKKRYNTTLFSWKGLNHRGYLFDESYTAYF